MNVLVIGGAGYVGSVLTPKLLDAGYNVRVFDLMIYGEDKIAAHPNLEIIKGDVRDLDAINNALAGIDTVIHLACISNDPSFDLNPELGKSINFDSFEPTVSMAKEKGVTRFIYASSSSVYGVKEEPNVTEELDLQPLTDYSLYKAKCEEVILKYQSESFTTVIIRPATVCGYSPRQRLDLVVNIFSNLSYNKGAVTVFGGSQKRPNIHIDDMTRLYVELCQSDKKAIAGKTFNVGCDNMTTSDIAQMVKTSCPKDVEVSYSDSDDLRSYHISSKKIEKELGFRCSKTIKDAVTDLFANFELGNLPSPLESSNYFNIKKMQEINLK